MPWHLRSHHSTAQHSQHFYTLLFANHPRRSPEPEFFARGGYTGGPVNFPPVSQTCQIALPECSDPNELPPAGTSSTVPGLLPALANPAAPNLAHHRWRDKTQHCPVAGEVSPREAAHSKSPRWSIQLHLAASSPSILWRDAARSSLREDNS